MVMLSIFLSIIFIFFNLNPPHYNIDANNNHIIYNSPIILAVNMI